MLDAANKAKKPHREEFAGPPLDFQEHLRRLEAHGLLTRIDRAIDKDRELHPLVRWQFQGGLAEEQRRAFLFTNVVDGSGRRYNIPVAVGALGASPEIYALGMGRPVADIGDAWTQGIANPIAPVTVPSGPCQEVVIKGPDLLRPGGGLAQLPVPISTPGFDSAPYLTATLCITRDPESGVQNMQPASPAVWDEVPNNILVDTRFGNATETGRAFERAAHIVTKDFHVGRVTGVPMEPRAAVAHYDETGDRYTIYAGSGGAVRQKRELAAVLGIEPDKIRVLSYDVGGNFGTRNRVYVEFGLVLWAARKLGRPVKYTATRSDCFVSDYQGRDLVAKFELALDERGRFLALRATNISNVGARCVSLSPLSKGAGLITGSYDIPVASLQAVAVFTNTIPTQAYRSSGRPEITFAIERLIDIAARRLGIDRVTLRRRNLVRPKAMPYRNAVGMVYDSGRYEENML